MTYTNDLIASVLGYPEETGDTPAVPQPDVLGSDGSYVALRKLHQRVTAFREYLRTNSADSEQEEWIAAKMMGRCRSGAPPTVCPCTTTLSLVRIHTANEGSFFGAAGTADAVASTLEAVSAFDIPKRRCRRRVVTTDDPETM